MMYINTKNI